SPSPTPAPPTATPTVTATPPPDATATPPPTQTPIPTATPTAGPHAADVVQPEYVESPCSDRFPCNDDVAAWEGRIQVPPGFAVSYLAQFPNEAPDPDWPSLQPTSLTFGPDGRLYVAFTQGSIHAINPDGSHELFFDGLTVPTGLAFQPGTNRLYVASRVLDWHLGGEGQILVIEDGQAVQLIGGLPCCYLGMHAPNGIAFGPDGYGYVGVGGRADHGEILDGTNTQDVLLPFEAVILRFSPDGTEVEVYARGLRNPYDIAWGGDGVLYATDNGRDEVPNSGETVPEEVHAVVPGGEHGYPYYDCGWCFGIPDGIEVVPPLAEFPPHSVPTGITAYLAEQFPGYYNSLFLTLWTALPFAERVVRLLPDGTMSTFATGFAAPIDVTTGPDGSLYVADYATGIIFRITYVGEE
ncbi:MAG: PQQ-dependent sugar dehydrogenase, partial [Anaerolineales bacterium]|nr:PQQ-dependent sugar dehydrogenase [Anaerolineales bacterium]